MLNFCTLFDSNYLAKGLCMYESLKLHCPEFTLFIFAFDVKSHSILQKLELGNVVLIPLEEFEDDELIRVKTQRTVAEYCWTSTSSTILYCLEKYSLDHCTYIDADVYFFDDPSVLVRELSNKDVLITEHRYTPKYDRSSLSGKYCVQFITFRNNQNGIRILKWWRNACLDWCYARSENGKFGDQKYLDDWTERFEGIHVMQHWGGGVAPWNVQRIKILREKKNIQFVLDFHDKPFDLVFYHFHLVNHLRFGIFDEFNLGPYMLPSPVISRIYKPYLKHLDKVAQEIKALDDSYDGLGSKVLSLPLLLKFAHGINNFFRKNKIIRFHKWQN